MLYYKNMQEINEVTMAGAWYHECQTCHAEFIIAS